MGIVNALGSWYFKGRQKGIEQSLRLAPQIQESTLQKLVQEGEHTHFGKQYSLSEIRTYDDFKKHIPLFTYEEFFPFINQMLQGEQYVSWSSPINWFAKSSGTTNDKSKFIPISYENLEECHFAAGKDVLCTHFMRNSNSRLFEGKGLLIGGSNQTNPLNQHSNYGDLSAVLMNEMPFWANLAKTPDLSIALLENWDEKVIKMAEATLKDKVTSISGVPTWTLVLLRKILEISGEKDIRSVWPELELFIHGGISFEPYREAFYQLIGDQKVELIETYNASEGFFGIQLKANEPMTLMPQYGIFFEFKDLHTGEIHALSSVETNVNYELIITTNTGLWRYRIGDTIMFSDLDRYHFKITGRTKHHINAFGEELMVHNADEALRQVCQKHGTTLVDYTAAPEWFSDLKGKIGRHEWIICLTDLPESQDEFTHDLDISLQKLNSDYQAKRHGDIAMDKPKVLLTTDLVFEDWLRKKDKLGGQHKVPRLNNKRNILEEILSQIRVPQQG